MGGRLIGGKKGGWGRVHVRRDCLDDDMTTGDGMMIVV